MITQIYFSQRIAIMESSSRTTSYHDLLRHFKQAGTNVPAPRSQKPVGRKLHLKSSHRPNKENTKNHTQSVHEKSATQKIERSEWVEEDVLKQYNEKRKDRQLELSYNNFIAYITNILAALTSIVPPELLTRRLTYLQYLAALKEMTLIKESYEPSPSDPVSELWNELTLHGVNCGIFILFVASILNMRRHDDQSQSKYAYLAKNYAQLRYTRMELHGKSKCLPEEEEFPFTPCISQRSRTLAASRSKSRNRNTKCFAQQSYNHELEELDELQPVECLDSLAGNRRSEILYKLAKEKSLEKRRDKRSNEVEYQKSITQLTFRPKIHPNSTQRKSQKTIQGEQDSINRIIRGRVEREVRKIINQKGLPYNEKLFEKMKRERYEALQKQRKSECHHHTYHQQSLEVPQKVEFEGGVAGREEEKEQEQEQEEERERQVEEGEERGEAEGGRAVKPAKNEPIVLTIEVDEDRCQKLVIDDPSQYKEAAAKFIQDLGLPAEMYHKLIKGVERALQFQLTQVDEDSGESEQNSLCE